MNFLKGSKDIIPETLGLCRTRGYSGLKAQEWPGPINERKEVKSDVPRIEGHPIIHRVERKGSRSYPSGLLARVEPRQKRMAIGGGGGYCAEPSLAGCVQTQLREVNKTEEGRYGKQSQSSKAKWDETGKIRWFG